MIDFFSDHTRPARPTPERCFLLAQTSVNFSRLLAFLCHVAQDSIALRSAEGIHAAPKSQPATSQPLRSTAVRIERTPEWPENAAKTLPVTDDSASLCFALSISNSMTRAAPRRSSVVGHGWAQRRNQRPRES